MGRLGKTTLVKKVYEDKKVKRHFQNHAWITVSQFKIEELLKDLIQQLFNEVKRPVPVKLETMDNNKLKAMLSEFLQESRYVLVLDDVWSIDVWDAIKIALPNSNCGSHGLLTTRIESTVTFLIKKLSSLVEEELKFLGGVKREFVFIRDELESMRAFLRVADALEGTDVEIQA
ncbi:Disease resistance protein RPM1 [Camellia lanceoleosa]|uniref:Disease resistance protein RPM1 n=1 Tax=Camellia lanceoleosa TaxID=1840588 RepID=A0ACC0FIB8_9ERIC|nr:Disease resistance protein RPM1 [Camellia lanceoleosa]